MSNGIRNDDHVYRIGQTNDKGQIICGSRRSTYPKNKKPCQSTAVMTNGRCRVHGGATPKGLMAPQTTHGKYSKYLPKGLSNVYGEALQDDELLSLQHEIALLDARLIQLLARVETGESGSLWQHTQSAFIQLQAGLRSGDQTATQDALIDLNNLIRRGNADYAAWNEIERVIQQRRALVESQRKRELETGMLMRLSEMDMVINYLGVNLQQLVLNTIPRESQREFLTGFSTILDQLLYRKPEIISQS